jgi:L-rhamnose mutarotase
MKTHVFTLDLKDDPDLIAKYKQYHSAVWPEVIEGIKKIGLIHNRIYLLGNRLVMILDTEDTFDPDHDLVGYTDKPRAKEWDELMKTFQEPLPWAKPGEYWLRMDLVFDLDQYI